jgi:hypothetical protein
MPAFKQARSRTKGKNAGARPQPRHLGGIMKRILALFCVAAISVWADTSFWRQMTPEERKAAGIDQLTAEQQQALDRAAVRFAKEGARREVEQARQEAKAEAVAEVKAEQRKQKIANAGLAARDDDETIRTRIIGDFRGWEGNTTFRLENGQVWQQTDKQQRFFPKMVNPEIELVPSKWAGWKLTLVSEGLWIRVKRVQ